MGYIAHKTAMAVFDSNEDADAFEIELKNVIEPFYSDPSFNMAFAPVRFDNVFLFPLDGSKIGWETSIVANKARQEFIKCCEKYDAFSSMIVLYDEEGIPRFLTNNDKGKNPFSVILSVHGDYEDNKIHEAFFEIKKTVPGVRWSSKPMVNGYQGDIFIFRDKCFLPDVFQKISETLQGHKWVLIHKSEGSDASLFSDENPYTAEDLAGHEKELLSGDVSGGFKRGKRKKI